MTTRKGDWMQTFSGVQFWPLDPRPEDIHLADIAHALSNLCRFGGHCPFYSVAQHSVMVSVAAEASYRGQLDEPGPVPRQGNGFGGTREQVRAMAVIGLLHDATEAYLIDVPRPIKRNLAGYHEIEARLAHEIGVRFGFPLVDLPRCVKEADERALFTEKRDLLKPAPAPWTIAQGVSSEPLPIKVQPVGPEIARELFLERAKELGIR